MILFKKHFYDKPVKMAPTSVIKNAHANIDKFLTPLISLYKTIPQNEATIGGPLAPIKASF